MSTSTMSRVVTFASTMDLASGRSYEFQAGSTFVQKFRAGASGVPTQLVVRMGRNQTPYAAMVTLACNGRIIFSSAFADRVQRPSDWGSVFELDGARQAIQAGDWVEVTITPDASIGMEPLLIDDADFPRGDLTGYGPIVARFCLLGTPAPASDTVPPAGSEVRIHLRPDPVPGSGDLPQDFDDGTFPIGMRILAQVDNEPGIVVDRARWDIDDRSVFAQSCAQTPQAGTITPLTMTTGNPLAFYSHTYGHGGVTTFSVSIDVHNSQGRQWTVNRDGEITVTRPTYVSLTPLACAGVRVNRAPNGIKYLQFGNPWPGTTRRPGVGFSLRVAAAGRVRQGQIAVIQLIRAVNTATKPNGEVITDTTNSQWLSDRSLPYPGSTAQFNAQGIAELRFNDSPGIGLRSGCIAMSANQTMRSYIVYKSMEGDIPSFWMPIGYVEWAWAASISRASVNDPWPDEPAAGSTYTSALQLTFTPCDGPLLWPGNISQLTAIDDAMGMLPLPILPIDWIDHANDARQMEVRFVGVCTPDLVASLNLRLGVPIGPFIAVPQSYLVWATPTQIPIVMGIPGVIGFGEVPASRHYLSPKTPREQEIYRKAKKFSVSIAPQCFFEHANPDDVAWAATAAKGLADVGADLLALLRANGMTNVSVSPKSAARLGLSFTSPPLESMLPIVASHPQVHEIEIDPSFRPDDPTDPDQ